MRLHQPGQDHIGIECGVPCDGIGLPVQADFLLGQVFGEQAAQLVFVQALQLAEQGLGLCIGHGHNDARKLDSGNSPKRLAVCLCFRNTTHTWSHQMGEARRKQKLGIYPAISPKPAAKPTPLSAVHWEKLGAVEDHPKGPSVLAALEKLNAQLGPSMGGKAMVTLVETAGGLPLLEITVTGMNAWLSLVEAFQALGLVDKLEDDFEAQSRYDAIFS